MLGYRLGLSEGNDLGDLFAYALGGRVVGIPIGALIGYHAGR